jgi:hypothetical protein
MSRTLAASRGHIYLNLAKVGVEGSNPFARSKISFVRSGHMGYGLFWRYG